MVTDVEEAQQLLENSQNAQWTYFKALIRIIERQATQIKLMQEGSK